jgi:hypothetical protein
MKEWCKVDEERKRQNVAMWLRYKEEKMEWEVAKKKVVAQKKQFRVPALKLVQCLGPYPKPALVVPLGESENEGKEEEDSSDSDG